MKHVPFPRLGSFLALTVCITILAGCGDSEADERRQALAFEREMARIELDAERQKLELEQEMKQREAERIRRAQQQERERQAQARRDAAAAAQRQAQQRQAERNSRDRQVIQAIEKTWRWSLLDDGSKVLILKNTRPYSVDFYLKCTSTAGRVKTLYVSLPALGTQEIGFAQGWDNNWYTGETAQAIYNQSALWTVRIP